MKKLNTMIVTLSAAGMLAAGGLKAQTVTDVPFDFTVQNTVLPAGHYSMSYRTRSR